MTARRLCSFSLKEGIGVSSRVKGGDEYVYVYKPEIYGQRFTCLPASDEGQYSWINRVFLKVIDGKFFIDDQVLPGSPKGFGLIAGSDSGSGVIVVQNGQAHLVGIASSGQIEPGFADLQNNLEIIKHHASYKINPDAIKILSKYEAALKKTDRDKKWFITQHLADLTHLKDWVLSIIK